MKIKAGLNSKSIGKMIDNLKNCEYQLRREMVFDFLRECCKWFIERANKHLDRSDVGANVIKSIQNGWTWAIGEKSATIINTSSKAVFVEFGVGMVGGTIPHPEVPVDYQYDKNDHQSKSNGYWVYYANTLDDVDMHEGYIVRTANGGGHKLTINDNGIGASGGFWIITKGSWGDMYAYNTLVDLQTEKKVMSGLWQKVKEKYWGKDKVWTY